jgi:hypothetical protein
VNAQSPFPVQQRFPQARRPMNPMATRPFSQPVQRPQPAAIAAGPALRQPPVPDHPLAPALRWAYGAAENAGRIQDYSCTFIKRERIDGQLTEHTSMALKVRHEPFSVYMDFQGPPDLKGQEVIYVAGRNDGKLLAHTVGLRDALVGTVSLDPTGAMAMKGNRHAITEIGIRNLTNRLIAMGEGDSRYGECDVQNFKNAKVGQRTCTCMQFTHPIPRREFRYHIARVYIDDELNLPIRYESYDWPRQAGQQPALMEEFTYMDLKLNNGFTDADFDVSNPAYRFR